MSTDFVLLHGGFHGGWCWRRVAERLVKHGHRVFCPTQTGLGERAHLIGPEVGIETFIADVIGVFDSEELTDAVLVGHSFGGIAITGVADRIPDRIRHLVYLDAIVLENGERYFDVLPPEFVEKRMASAETRNGASVATCPPAAVFGMTNPADIAWADRRLTPHPMRTFTDRLILKNSVGNGRPCTYIACTDPVFPLLPPMHERARAKKGWQVKELVTSHNAMMTVPDDLTRLLLEVASHGMR